MPFLNIDPAQIQSVIRQIAQQELLPRFTRIKHSHKADGSIVTEADIAAQTSICKALTDAFPASVVLGEEMTAEEQAMLLASDQPVWCIDPLDGTSNFAAGIPYFAISLALIEHGEVTLGIVYDPMRDECFTAQKSKGQEIKVDLNGDILINTQDDISLKNATAIVDFKRLTNELASRIVTERPFASQRNFGASALDWCWLATGRGHVYLHGNQNLWDYAAGEMIFRASGGYASTLQGEKIYKNALIKRSVVAGINQSLYTQWANWLNLPVTSEVINR